MCVQWSLPTPTFFSDSRCTQAQPQFILNHNIQDIAISMHHQCKKKQLSVFLFFSCKSSTAATFRLMVWPSYVAVLSSHPEADVLKLLSPAHVALLLSYSETCCDSPENLHSCLWLLCPCLQPIPSTTTRVQMTTCKMNAKVPRPLQTDLYPRQKAFCLRNLVNPGGKAYGQKLPFPDRLLQKLQQGSFTCLLGEFQNSVILIRRQTVKVYPYPKKVSNMGGQSHISEEGKTARRFKGLCRE